MFIFLRILYESSKEGILFIISNFEYIAGFELFKINSIIIFSLFFPFLYQSFSHLIIDFIFSKLSKNFSTFFFNKAESKEE